MSPQTKPDWNTSSSLWQLSFDLVCCLVCSLKFTASVTGQKISDFRSKVLFCYPQNQTHLNSSILGPPPSFSLKICLVSLWLSWLEQHPCHLQQQQSHSTALLLGSRQQTMTLAAACLCAHTSLQGQAHNFIGVHFRNVICIMQIHLGFPIYLQKEKLLFRSQALPLILLLQAALSFKWQPDEAKYVLTPPSYIFKSNWSSHLTHYV